MHILAVNVPNTWQPHFNKAFSTHTVWHIDWHQLIYRTDIQLHSLTPRTPQFRLRGKNVSIHAIFCTEPSLPLALFCHYPPADVDYIYQAFQAWWMSVIFSIPCENAPYWEKLSPSYWNLLRLYQVANVCNLTTPAWNYHSNDQKLHLPHASLITYDFGCHFDLYRQHQTDPLRLEKKSKDFVFCLVIHQRIHWSVSEPILSTYYTDRYAASILQFAAHMQSNILQLCFNRPQDGTLIFFHASPSPNWDNLWHTHKKSICSNIASLLTACHLHNEKKANTFIPNTHRPSNYKL